MKNNTRISSLILAGTMLLGCFSGCSNTTKTGTTTSVKKITLSNNQISDIKQSINKSFKNSDFSGTIYGSYKNQNVISNSYGYSDKNKKHKLSENNYYELGDCTMVLTGLAIMKLESENKIKTSDPVSKYIGGYSYLKKVTVKNLLEMTSGFNNYSDFITSDKEYKNYLYTFLKKKSTYQKSNKKVLDYILKHGLDYSTGDYHYASTNYFILGAIINKVTNKGFLNYLQKEILNDIGVKFNGSINSALKYKVVGYDEEKKEWKTPYLRYLSDNYYFQYSASGLMYTGKDVNTIVSKIFNNKILKGTNCVDKILKTDSSFNYGFNVDGKIIYALGQNRLNSSYFYFDTEKNIKTILLSNHSSMTNSIDTYEQTMYNAINKTLNGIILKNS